MAGWIKIYRNITEMQGYFGEKFNRPMCWIDLVLLAECEPRDLSYRGIKVVVERGQLAVSVRELSDRWSLSMPTARKRLKEFADEGRIAVASSNVVNIITILNYEQYTDDGTGQKPQLLDLFREPPQQAESKPKAKPKPQKHHYAPSVLLTDEEHGKLVAEHGKDGAAWMIQKLDDYKAARGMTYKSDYRAILNWVVRAYKKQQQYGTTSEIGQPASSMAKARRNAEFTDYIAGKLGSGFVQGEVQDEQEFPRIVQPR